MQKYFIGVGGQIVGALVVAPSPCHDLLAARFKTLKASGHFTQRCQAAAAKFIEYQYNAVDLCVIGGGLENREHVAQLYLRGGIALDFAQYPIR